MTFTFVAGTPPIVTVTPSWKSVPETLKNVPPAGGPEGILIEKGRRCESSDVFPAGSVAVAEIGEPAAVEGSMTSKDALPAPSVVVWDEPRYVLPCLNSRGKREQTGFE